MKENEEMKNNEKSLKEQIEIKRKRNYSIAIKNQRNQIFK